MSRFTGERVLSSCSLRSIPSSLLHVRLPVRIVFLAVCAAIAWPPPFLVTERAVAESRPPQSVPDWTHIIETNRERLITLESDQSATDAFVTALGPSLGLGDVAGTIAAKGLPAKLAKELTVADITRSAQRLVAALAAWELADTTGRAIRNKTGQEPPQWSLSPAKLEWLKASSSLFSLTNMFQQTTEPPGATADLAVAAGQTALEASQQAVREWWYLKTWKDRVRTFRGQARLCGTWQWVIHNHQQHHQEQKLSLLFPPPGKEGTGIPGLTEIIVLGDTVYLRWEIDGRTQEDSLLFTKEAQRLEGTFVNSQGGWGSISGKRTATCTP